MGPKKQEQELIHQLIKGVGLVAGMKVLWNAYCKAKSITWKDASEGTIYQSYLNFCQFLVQIGIVPTYLPLDGNGTKYLNVPSSSQQVYAQPPTKLGNSKAFQPLKLRGLEIKNRIIRAAAFDGEKEEEMIETHVDQAKGGVGMTTVAYCCISDDGKSFDGQLVMEESRREFLCKLTSQVNKHGAAISAQLTHGGSFADRETIGKRQIAPSSVFSPSGINFAKEMTLEECEIVANNFGKAAKLAKETGFQAIELHCGHGYLLSQFLSPVENYRTDKFGGSDEKRAAFPAYCLQKCRLAVGEDFPILVKLNVHDGVRGGLELPGATIAADILADAGADALVITGGMVSKNAFYMMRGAIPQAKLVQAYPHAWRKIALMIFGPFAVPTIEYQDCFFRDAARHILKKVGHKTKVCLMGGVNSFAEMEGAIEEGFSFVQVARAFIREPDMVNRIQATLELMEEGKIPDAPQDIQSNCIRCNQCVVATVDPSASFGCPFQRMDVKRREKQGLDPILSVEGMKALILAEQGSTAPVSAEALSDSLSSSAGISASPVSALANAARDLRDIEDLIKAPHIGKM